jgi:hypothetical protein
VSTAVRAGLQPGLCALPWFHTGVTLVSGLQQRVTLTNNCTTAQERWPILTHSHAKSVRWFTRCQPSPATPLVTTSSWWGRLAMRMER